MKILVTGGCGFVGSSLACLMKETYPAADIVAFDNLKRRGSEKNVTLFKKSGISFRHGDIRSSGDLNELDAEFDLVIDAAAEPSVLAGTKGSPEYVLKTNLVGTLNVLEYIRKRGGALVLLSTSRVYSIEPLQNIRLKESATRFELMDDVKSVGLSILGISEVFSTQTHRSIYGASKLASELIAQEYASAYGIPVIINRCGVIAGPGQFGKVDQGVFSLWMMHHFFRKPLTYMGFGGEGKQVRDLLHPRDLFQLILKQMDQTQNWTGDVYNVGGGNERSISLNELTTLCQELTGNQTQIVKSSLTSTVDIPFFVTDSSRVQRQFNWEPKASIREIFVDIFEYIKGKSMDVEELLV